MAEDTSQVPEGCTHNCETCSFGNCSGRSVPQKFKPFDSTKIKKIIAVNSGKGGVGKSAVTCLLASKLAADGKKVAILDADITGPSVPQAFGITDRPSASLAGMVPVETKTGIEMISLNLLLDDPELPVAWRGPMIGGAIRQFYEEVMWGEVDYMLIDMPPGTSDVFLTIMQMLPVDGIVTVTSPQELVNMIVGKAANLASELNVPIVALVENMAYFQCDECGKKHYIFGDSKVSEVAKKYNIDTFASLPLDPKLASFVDAGKVEDYETSPEIDKIVKSIEGLK